MPSDESDRSSTVTQTERLEIVDEMGRVRITLSAKHPLREGEADGLRFFDADGHEVVSLLFQSDGTVLSFALEGNTVAELGVRGDHGAAITPGSYLVLCAGDGSPVLAWEVALDGGLSVVHRDSLNP